MKDLYIKEQTVILNFNQMSCDSEAKVLSSKAFRLVLMRYLNIIKKENNTEFKWLLEMNSKTIIDVYKLLVVWNYDEVNRALDDLIPNEKRESFYHFTETFYDYWRDLERFGTIGRLRSDDESQTTNRLIDVSESFNQLILKLYRTITQNISGQTFNLLRQLPAGLNANFTLVNNPWSQGSLYDKLPTTNFVSSMLLRPPFMIYSKSNTRKGIFSEVHTNPISELNLEKNNYVVFAVYVGELLAYVYCHKSFLKYGVALGSLFKMPHYDAYKNKKPDLLYIFGTESNDFDGTYYHDKDLDIYVGSVSLDDKNDYFGYAKKMLLTLHNVYMINHKSLPIHGAMVQITFKDNSSKNVVIIGDSGAGKSETIEALQDVSKGIINDIKVIYDDMGTFIKQGDTIKSIGTEIGAFVRLDDLDTGYAYKKIDRAVFLNPNKVNARVILPVATHEFIAKPHLIDYVFYANNYAVTDEGYNLFNSLDDALPIFRKGVRVAKGTTNEVGFTETYFANPFGPVQHEKETEILLQSYFSDLFKQGTHLGELYTQLAVDGKASSGPREAALKLLNLLSKK